MSFPLWLLLVPFAGILLLAIVLVFFNVFHLNRYGVAGTGTRAVMASYVLGFFFILLLSGSVLLGINWGGRVAVADLLPFSIESNQLGL